VIAAAAFLITSAGAGASAIPKVDLSTNSGVAKYLKSIGVSPKGVVIQRGLRNYAGPRCPGARWHCTSARHVFQIAAAGGDNKFECSGTDTSGFNDQGCTIMQTASGGKNEATCRERLTLTPDASQACEITQVNVNGDNKATVDQDIKQKDGGASQTARQISTIDQTNTLGKNDAKVDQKIDQDLHGDTSQDQNAEQTSCLKQHGPANPQDACDEAFPPSGDTGNDSSDLHQDVHQDEHAGNAVVTLNQDSDIFGHVSQDTTGIAKNHNDQHENQHAEGKNATVFQFGPMHCCSDQGTNPGDKFDINQHSDQHTNADDFDQSEQITGVCETTGNCHVDQDANENGQHQKNMCNSNSCSIGIVCDSSGSSEGDFGECTPCTPVFGEGIGCVTECSECECVSCLTTFSLEGATAHQAARPQALKLMRRSALLH